MLTPKGDPMRKLVLLAHILVVSVASHAQQQALTLPSMFHFDGTSYITLSNSPALAPTSQITISAWIKPDFTVTNVVDTILDKRDGCGFNRSYQLGVYKSYQYQTPGTLFFAAGNANVDDLISTVPIPNDGEFHHVAGAYDGATTKLFLDGVLVAQGTHTGALSITSDPPVIGIQAGCGDPTYADISQIRIYNYAVPDGQIMSDAAGLPPGVALLSGGNNFTGNQNVAGTVAAYSFAGDGSLLTNITAANIASGGTAAINISGSAASAVTASSASNAVNSLNLGDVAATNYARVDIGNNFSGNQIVTGNVTASGNLSTVGTTTMGGGTPIVEHLSATFDPTLPALKPSTCATANFTITGAGDGNTLALGVPNARTTGGGTILYFAWVSAANTITVEACNISASPQKTAGSGAIRVDLWKH
jgi:concanavalin A-like lectin/glucanase superfamily protein